MPLEMAARYCVQYFISLEQHVVSTTQPIFLVSLFLGVSNEALEPDWTLLCLTLIKILIKSRAAPRLLHFTLPSFSLFDTALSLAPEQAESPPWSSPVLVLPVLQLLSCSGLTEPLADQRTHSQNHDLAHSLLRSISRPTDKPREVNARSLLELNL